MSDCENCECLRTRLTWLEQLASAQAEDESMWFVAETAAEAYLQLALRRLHHAIEGTADQPSAT